MGIDGRAECRRENGPKQLEQRLGLIRQSLLHSFIAIRLTNGPWMSVRGKG